MRLFLGRQKERVHITAVNAKIRIEPCSDVNSPQEINRQMLISRYGDYVWLLVQTITN